MQASKAWEPPTGTLGQILAETRERVASLNTTHTTRADTGRPRPRGAAVPGFEKALRRPDVAVVAEIKRRSPSKGELNPTLSAGEQARRFERAGAAAISVLTEPTRFGGSPRDLEDAAEVCALPLLRKDFHVDPVQLDDAARSSAAAVLLIARALPPDDLVGMLEAATARGLEAVVEVRSEAELAIAIEAGARIIGVNSRDLETLEIDESVPARLIPRIPADRIAIWESGVARRPNVEQAAAAGADAVLVGSALSRAADVEQLLGSLTGVARRQRRG